MQGLRWMHSLQKLASNHGSVHDLFNTERSPTSRTTYKQARAAALAEWRTPCTG